MSVDYHAWTHRPEWVGGTDPIEPQLPYMRASLPGGSQAITASVEPDMAAVTNSPRLFCWDPTDSPGMLITRGGLYMAMAEFDVASIHQTVEREMIIGIGSLSDGPAPGGEFGTTAGWIFGSGQGDHSTNVVTATSGGKTRLGLMATQTLSVPDSNDPDDIFRLALYVFHTGTNYTITKASLTIVRIGTDVAGIPPVPVIGT